MQSVLNSRLAPESISHFWCGPSRYTQKMLVHGAQITSERRHSSGGIAYISRESVRRRRTVQYMWEWRATQTEHVRMTIGLQLNTTCKCPAIPLCANSSMERSRFSWLRDQLTVNVICSPLSPVAICRSWASALSMRCASVSILKLLVAFKWRVFATMSECRKISFAIAKYNNKRDTLHAVTRIQFANNPMVLRCIRWQAELWWKNPNWSRVSRQASLDANTRGQHHLL